MLATTLTLVAVFVPVAFMPGIVGQFFKQFGLTISAAVLISLFISFTLDPMLSARLAKQRKPGEVRKEVAVARALRLAFEATERGYERVLRLVLRHKWISFGVTVLVTVAVFAGTSGLRSEFLAVEDRAQFIVDLQLPDSVSLDLSAQRELEAERALKTIPEVTDVYGIVGLNGEANKVKLRALLTPKKSRKRGIVELKALAREALANLPATRVFVSDPPTIEGLGDFFPVMVRLTGPDLEVLEQQGKYVADVLRAIPGTVDIKIDTNPPKPELAIAVDRTRAADLGLSSAQIATQLRLAIDGEVPAKLREGKDETDIRVRLAERDRNNTDRVRSMDLFSPRGTREVSDVARVRIQDGPSVIEHENRERQIGVYSQLGAGGALGEIAQKLQAELAAHPLPPGYSIIYDGQMKTFGEQQDAFAGAFALAFVFIFMVLASQFESLHDHGVAAARAGRRAPRPAPHRQEPEPGSDDRHHPPHGSGDQECHPSRRRGAAEHPRRSLRRRGARPRRPAPAASHPHDFLCHGDRDGTNGSRHWNRQRVPFADGHRGHRRRDHLHRSHAARGTGHLRGSGTDADCFRLCFPVEPVPAQASHPFPHPRTPCDRRRGRGLLNG